MSKTANLIDNSRPLDLICMGRVAVDFYAEQLHSPLEDAQSFRKYLGGCAGNTAVGTSRLGLNSTMFSCIGTDDMGVYLQSTLEKEGVDTSLLRSTAEHLTALVLLGVNPPERFPLIFYRENCADMQIQPEDADPEIFKKAKALLITGTGLSTAEMREATRQAVKVAKECGCAVILDIDYRPVLWGLTEAGDGETRFVASEEVTREIQPFLADLDLIVGTEEEVQICAGKSVADSEETLESCLAAIRQQSSATVVLKRGADGCEVYSPESANPVSARSFQIEVLNVLGAGDAFMSGFLRGWLRKESLQTCALYGNACGALVVTRHGCSPAAPSFAEIEYFIQHFDDTPNSAQPRHQTFWSKMNQLHMRTELGQPQKEELLILAFDHRTQFEDTCRDNGLSTDKIADFKDQVCKGFQNVRKSNSHKGLAILIDPEYGRNILTNSADADYTIGVPIEKAGSFPVEWLSEDSLYQQLLVRPADWFVKVLWHFHSQMSSEEKILQLAQLKKLNEVCAALKRKLMLELIIPEDFAKNESHISAGKTLGDAMTEVYQAGINPYWWKITALDTEEEWQTMTGVLDKYDPEVGVIILGNNAPIEQFDKWFRVARSTPHTCGFAVGRSIFWEPWIQFAEGKITETEVTSMIEEHYQQVINIWHNT